MNLRRAGCLGGVVLAAAVLLGKSDGQQFSEYAPPRPVEGFDINQLPAGKTIGVEPGDARVLEALKQPAEFTLSEAKLQAFADEIASKFKISVKLDVAALTADGKGADTTLNGKTSGTSLRSALRLFLAEQQLAFTVDDEALLITTNSAAETHTSTRLYQVHDLTLQPNDPVARPDFERLIELLTSTIQPEAWREAGGTIGEIRSFEGPGISVLVVHHTDEGHEQVEKLLGDLRAAKIQSLLELQQKRERAVYRPTIPGGMSGASS